MDQLHAKRWTTEKMDQYLEDISFLEDPAQMDTILQNIGSLVPSNPSEQDILLHLRANDLDSLNNIEVVLISLLGNELPKCREFATKQLNILYDGHDWQSQEALTTVVRTIDDTFAIKVTLDQNISLEESNVYLLVSSPSSTNSNYILSRYFKRFLNTQLSCS